jgi:hypothetical protein
MPPRTRSCRRRARGRTPPNEKAAEAAAVAEFDLDDEQRRGLVVQERN